MTGLVWSSIYTDLFAVSFGSFAAAHQRSGAVAAFSLKNPVEPEYQLTTESGAGAGLIFSLVWNDMHGPVGRNSRS